MEGNGFYRLLYNGTPFYTSNGQYGYGENFSINVDFQTYIFEGPGIDWDNASNWNKGKVPSECYKGNIKIAADCEKVGSIPLNQQTHIRILNDATLTIK
jgi:hypothetical protein